MKELKRQDSVEVKMSGTFVTIDTDACRRLIGAADVLCELTTYEFFMLFMDRICVFVPVLLKTHRPDVYGILSVLNEKTAEEIVAQPMTATLTQIHDVLHDEGLHSFFKSFMRRGKSRQSAPSSAVPG